ncbi:hypothetical protein ASZ78_003579, partial [Callipepla squamata]
LAKIWSSASYYLGQQLALYQAVHIPGLGSFTVVRENVVSQQKGLVVVDRPVFHLAKVLAQDHDLLYDSIDVPGHDWFRQLPYARIASENGISEGAAQLCVERTVCQFGACIHKSCSIAFIWWDVGMLLIEGRRVQMRFFEDYLGKLNGTTDALQALLAMPEMSKSVMSRHDSPASLTTSGHVTVFPMFKHEFVMKEPTTARVELKYRVKSRQGWATAGDTGRKGDLCETRLLHRPALSPRRLPAGAGMPERGQKAEEKEPRTRQLPAIPGRSLKEGGQEKAVPLRTPRMVDFFAEAREKYKQVTAEMKLAQTKKEEKGKNGKKEVEVKETVKKGKKEMEGKRMETVKKEMVKKGVETVKKETVKKGMETVKKGKEMRKEGKGKETVMKGKEIGKQEKGKKEMVKKGKKVKDVQKEEKEKAGKAEKVRKEKAQELAEVLLLVVFPSRCSPYWNVLAGSCMLGSSTPALSVLSRTGMHCVRGRTLPPAI